MNGFLLAILLPLLLVSITPDVSALKCYKNGVSSEFEKECNGNDVVCFSVVEKDNEGRAISKDCGERNEAKSMCQERARWYNGKCKEPCPTDLCNNEDLEYPDYH